MKHTPVCPDLLKDAGLTRAALFGGARAHFTMLEDALNAARYDTGSDRLALARARLSVEETAVLSHAMPTQKTVTTVSETVESVHNQIWVDTDAMSFLHHFVPFCMGECILHGIRDVASVDGDMDTRDVFTSLVDAAVESICRLDIRDSTSIEAAHRVALEKISWISKFGPSPLS